MSCFPAGTSSGASALPAVASREEFREGGPTRRDRDPAPVRPDQGRGADRRGAHEHACHTVRPDVTLARAVRIMAKKHVKRLPVVDDEERPTGVVGRGDLLKVFLRSDEDIEEEVRRTVISCLFPTVGHAIHVFVQDGVVTLRGRVPDTSLIWVAERLVHAVEGVVAVEARLGAEDAAPDAAETTP
ncbi:CBS domain-containing protein [Streptomyces sp. NRRL B-2790]|uniref:CBS domain-containing protein n=2 Tax=unclassified Streptomyces TaxID=2593676 RepID=UPI000AB74301